MNNYIEIYPFKNNAVCPVRSTPEAAGWDVYAYLNSKQDPLFIKPGERKVVGTGLNVSIPKGYFIDVRPRSGMAAKHGIGVLNAPGTIDSDYCGRGEDFEIKVILVNHSSETYKVHHGAKIAQLVPRKIEDIEFICRRGEMPENMSANRGRQGGLGSTGTK